MSSKKGRGVSGWVVVCLAGLTLWPAHANTPALQSLPLAQILASMERRNQIQREELKHYRAVRQYHVEYQGITTIDAGMVVEINFDGASGKSFRIVSESGSRILADKILKRAMESEVEASKDSAATALTPVNYRFQLQGRDRKSVV